MGTVSSRASQSPEVEHRRVGADAANHPVKAKNLVRVFIEGCPCELPLVINALRVPSNLCRVRLKISDAVRATVRRHCTSDRHSSVAGFARQLSVEIHDERKHRQGHQGRSVHQGIY
jgi:stage V sporulation protein SpoVS